MEHNAQTRSNGAQDKVAASLRRADFHVYCSPVTGWLLLHAPSCLVFSISRALADYLCRCDNEFIPPLPAADANATDVAPSEALSQVLSICQANSVIHPGQAREPEQSAPQWNPADHRWANLTLFVTDRCNLRCRYCFEGYGPLKAAAHTISRETATAALDFFFETLYPSADVYDLHLFGGEPLLEWEMVEWITLEAQRRAQAKGKPLYMSISTNAIGLTTERTQFLREHEFDVSVSLDGPQEVHDRFRVFPDGRGSFDDMCRGFAHLVRGRPPYSCVVGRFNRENKDAYRNVLAAYAVTEGRQGIAFKLSRLSPRHALSLRMEDVEEILVSYRPVLDLLLERLAARDYKYLTSLFYGNDYFARFIMRLRSRTPGLRRCWAGFDMYAVATDGRVYPCESMVGMEGWEVGDVRDGIDPQRHRPWLDLNVDKRNECRDCWARYLCGGGCYASALTSHGDLTRPDPIDCRFTRGLIELNMEFLVRAEAEAPGHLDKAVEETLVNAPEKHRIFVPPPMKPAIAMNLRRPTLMRRLVARLARHMAPRLGQKPAA
jgi:uncharacterized protein